MLKSLTENSMVLKIPVLETERERWDGLAENYDKEVYSLTKYPQKRARIVQEIRDNTRILIAGGGSAVYLQENILEEKKGLNVVLSDFSSSMLATSASKFKNNALSHVGADTGELPFKEESFDSVVSTNSIVAEERNAVQKMFDSIFKTLKNGGQFIAYLPSYEAAEDFSSFPNETKLKLDQKNFKVWDTVGWQCFHTQETIRDELAKAGFIDIEISEVKADSINEMQDLNRLYGSAKATNSFREHFVIAKKKNEEPQPSGKIIQFHRKETRVEVEPEILNLTSPEITPEIIDLVTRLYKEVFDNKGHFLYNVRTKKFFSPTEIFGEKDWYSFDKLIQIDPSKMIDPVTNDSLIVFHNAEKLREAIQKKLMGNAYLTLLGDVGFTFATETTLEEARQMEGWADPFYYSDYRGPRVLRNQSEFYEILNRAIWENYELLDVPKNTELTEESRIIVLNAIGITPKARGNGFGKKMAESLIKIIPEDSMLNYFDIAESVFSEKVVNCNKSGKTVMVSGILNKRKNPQPGDSVITIDKLSNY